MTTLWTAMDRLAHSLMAQAGRATTPPVQSGCYLEDAKRIQGVLDEYAGTDGRAPDAPRELWQELDDMAYNLKAQAHSGISEDEGRALLDVARRIEGVLKRYRAGQEMPTEFKFTVPIEAGGRYLIKLERGVTTEMAGEMSRRLTELFPDVTFGFAYGMEVLKQEDTITRTELLMALGVVAEEYGKPELRRLWWLLTKGNTP